MAKITREAVDCAPCMLRECPLKGEKHMCCMTGITVERVLQDLKTVLKKSGRGALSLYFDG